MNKQKSFLTVLIVAAACLSSVQAQNAVLVSGGDASGTGGSVACSVGQSAYTSYHGEDGSISLGVQQTYVIIMVATDDLSIGLSASIYPNPVTNTATLKLEEQSLKSYNTGILYYGLYDIDGKLLFRQEIVSTSTPVQLESLSGGIYILRITHNHTEIKTFKIFKAN